MSRTRKNIRKRALSKATKGGSKGNHFTENQARSHFPHMQPKPAWVRPTGKKGWWNGSKVRHEKASEEYVA